MSINAEERHDEMPSESDVSLQNDSKPNNKSVDDDSDSPSQERPTTLSMGTKKVISVDDSNSLESESLNTEESSLRRSVSSVEQSSKFRLRDISPSRLRDRHGKKKSGHKDSKSLAPSNTNKIRASSSWLPASFQQMFPSYKSKTGDFRRLFKDIPESEKLITDYSCALQRDILVHGRLYVSQSWLCFYANIFGWETLVTINLKHVTSMTKEKTALVIPNAVQIWTESEKFFFTSFVSRDSTYRSLTRIWKNILSDEPQGIPELMKAVGKYVDVDSEEVDNSSRGSNEEVPSDLEDDFIIDDDVDEDSLGDSEEQNDRTSLATKTEGDNNTQDDSASLTSTIPDIAVSPASPSETKAPKEHKHNQVQANGSVSRRESTETRRRFPFPFKKEFSPLLKRKNRQNKNQNSFEDLNDSRHRDSLIEDGCVSDSNEDEEVPILCPCESHLSLECLNEEYAIDVDRLYEYLFTDCDFYRSIRSSRKDFDLDIDPWVEDGDKKKRSVRYTVNLTLAIGPKTSRIHENQQLDASEPGQYYVVETNVINEGVPYADSFVVVNRYCLSRINPYMSRLRVTAAVKYVKPVWGFVKSMISKNSTEALVSFFDFLKNFVRTVESESVLNLKRRLKGRSRQSQDKKEESDEVQEETGEPVAVSSHKFDGRFSAIANHIWRDNNLFLGAFVFLLILLIVLNIYLSYRVISLERSTKSWETIGLPPLHNDFPTNIDEFRNLLYKQNVQFKRWQHVLSTAMQFLQQVQNSLNELQREVDKPLESLDT